MCCGCSKLLCSIKSSTCVFVQFNVNMPFRLLMAACLQMELEKQRQKDEQKLKAEEKKVRVKPYGHSGYMGYGRRE